MKSIWSAGTLIGLVAVVVLTFSFSPTKSQSPKGEPEKERRMDDDYLLLTLSENAELTDKRIQINSAYDHWNWVRSTVGSDATVAVLMNDWQVDLPALPTNESDAVVIGKIESGKAYLSNDGTGIYSEFTASVQRWLKGSEQKAIPTEDLIVFERPGGRILYPTGNIVTYKLSGQSMPELNGRYLFFLKLTKDGLALRLITAYEIGKDGKVDPLDGTAHSKVAGFKFHRYSGLTQEELVNDIEKALLQTGEKPSKKKRNP
jgi:hypothetical protein